MMRTEKKDEKKAPWTARRIVALVGILLLVGLYASTLVFALLNRPYAKGLLMGAVFCTIAVPVLLYAMTIVAGHLKGKGAPDQTPDQAAEEASEDASAKDRS